MEKPIMYEKIYSELLEKIQLGIYPPGSKVPTEKELSEEYNVSRITSKRALDMLAERKYIVRTRGRGSFVNPDSNPEHEVSPKISNPDRKLIGIIFDTFGADFGNDLLKSVERECRRLGYGVLFGCSLGEINRENEEIRRMIQFGANGLILMCAQGEVYNSTILQLSINEFPMVLVDRQMQGIAIPCVKTDNYMAAHEITELLISRGHKKICCISHCFDNTSTILDRRTGFTDCIMEYGDVNGTVEEIQRVIPESGDNQGYEILYNIDDVEKILHDNLDCTAFFTVEFPIGVILKKLMNKISVKKEIAAFDGLPDTYMEENDFICVRQDEKSMGIQAIRMLHSVIEGKSVENVINIPYEIKIPENKWYINDMSPSYI